jgi:hypothetical protein
MHAHPEEARKRKHGHHQDQGEAAGDGAIPNQFAEA